MLKVSYIIVLLIVHSLTVAMSDTKVIYQSMKRIAPVAASELGELMLMEAFSLPAAFEAVTFYPATGKGFVIV
ncbi:MAG TPA: hypothetical protein VKA91_01505 [Nitrososphaeraceae archaeon]|nr:hypothetical protein [Nitrososphaeraceae archaeon]